MPGVRVGVEIQPLRAGLRSAPLRSAGWEFWKEQAGEAVAVFAGRRAMSMDIELQNH